MKKEAEVEETLDEFDNQEADEGNEALEEFDFDDYLDDETPDYQLSIRNHGADVEEKTVPLGSGRRFESCSSTNSGCM